MELNYKEDTFIETTNAMLKHSDVQKGNHGAAPVKYLKVEENGQTKNLNAKQSRVEFANMLYKKYNQ